eukprot:632759_1
MKCQMMTTKNVKFTRLSLDPCLDHNDLQRSRSGTMDFGRQMSRSSSLFSNSQTPRSETSYAQTQTGQREHDIRIQMNCMDADQWEWDHVQVWLRTHHFEDLIKVFLDHDPPGLKGEQLLHLQITDFATTYRYTVNGIELDATTVKENSTLRHLMKKVTKLKLEAESDENMNKQKEHATITDYFEIKRRLQMFQNKWDKILWIEYYIDKYDEKPSPKIFSEEQGVSMEIAEAYLKIFDTEKEKNLLSKDLDELLMGFNPYNDCVLFWSIIIALLKLRNSRSLFMVFERVAEISPGSVAIKLLNKYKLELSRYETEQVDKIAQNVVIGSKYPVCAALRISEWFKSRESYDVSRAAEWHAISESFIEAAVDYLSNIRNDHFATILLECKSDIENRSALDMALHYRLTSFVKHNRVERVANSIMNDFEFLKIENIDVAFEIDEITLDSLIEKLHQSQFFFTPLGTFITELALYLVYLALFTYLSINSFHVYDAMEAEEILFWVLNMGYVCYEIQSIYSDGPRKYFADVSNYVDMCISFLFVINLSIRLYGHETGAGCVTPPDADRECYADSSLYTVFIILWSISTMLLWMRLFKFMILSHSLGPMVQMILSMMEDIGTFFKIMFVVFMGFSMCLMYVLKDVHEDFDSTFTSILTLLRAILGDFEFGAFVSEEHVNDSLLYFGIGVMLVYLVIGSLVFLNLLIAMMAKTFDTIQDDTTSAIVFSRFELAMIYDNNATFMPAPLNVISYAFFALFYLIEFALSTCNNRCCCTCCTRDKGQYPIDLAILMMPGWMKRRNLEIDDQIVCVSPTADKDLTRTKTINKQNSFHPRNADTEYNMVEQNTLDVDEQDTCTDDKEWKWEIKTNRGDKTKCRIIGYRQDIMKHTVQFKKRVCVGDSVTFQTRWLLDLWELKDRGAIDFAQFYQSVDHEWTWHAHQSMNKYKDAPARCPYWICRYCRGYVKRSAVSIKRLGRLMKVSDLEMKLVLSHAPNICPNCYRHREECKRWQLVLEIISAWLFEPVRWIMWVFLKVIAFISRCMCRACGKQKENDNEGGDDKDDIQMSDCVPNEIYDSMLLQQLGKYEQDEDDNLWNNGEQDMIWKTLKKAKENVDHSLLKKKIERHIMHKSIEDDHSYHEFKDDFVEFDDFVKFDHSAWNNHFEKYSHAIFLDIKRETSEKQPLQLFARYPFDVHMVLDEFDDWWEKEEIVKEQGKALKECGPDDHDFRRMLKDLNLFNSLKEEIDKHLDIILEDVMQYDGHSHELAVKSCFSLASKDDKSESVSTSSEPKKPKKDTFYDKFIHYLYRVQSLFQNPRKINNLIRDAKHAIVERGVNEMCVEDELYLLFEDITDASEAIAFFNAMRKKQFGDEMKVGLWSLLNTLKCLYFLFHTVKDQVLIQNARIYIDKQGLLDLVFEKFKYDIVDPKMLDGNDISDADEDEQEEEQEEKFSDIDEKEKDMRTKMKRRKEKKNQTRELTKRRLELFSKSQITARAIKREIEAIYETIKKKRVARITTSNIDFYRRQMGVKLLADEVSMNYIVNQLSRYATFCQNDAIALECTFAHLNDVLVNTHHFAREHDEKYYRIDKQMIPKYCQNLSLVRELHTHVLGIYNDARQGFDDTFYETHAQYMTILDVLSILLIYDRVFEQTERQMEDISDTFIVSHDVFCKFIDHTFVIAALDSDKGDKSVGPRSQIASDLYQSVLDVQQNFATLGEAYQTILKFIRDIDGMKCGEPLRIMEWIKTKKKEELVEYDRLRREWNKKTRHRRARSVKERRAKYRANPAIAFRHLSKKQWKKFVREISVGLKDNASAKDLMKHSEDINDHNRSKEIIDTIHEFVKLDVITREPEIRRSNSEPKHLGKKVFRTMFEFNSNRITLQQFFEFSDTMHGILRGNKTINVLMKRYERYEEGTRHVSDESTMLSQLIYEETHDNHVYNIDPRAEQAERTRRQAFQREMKQTFEDFADFKQRFFDERYWTQKDARYKKMRDIVTSKSFLMEIEWFYEGTRNVKQLCRRLYPFWSLGLIKSIHEFLESTDLINGTYELKAAEFAQFKHELHVNDALAHDLFHLIRLKRRSLSWEQCRRYFAFLLQQRYRIKKAILKSPELEDTTISKDALKTELEISSNDEAKWMFNKVQEIHGAKVTWKQIRNYLEKMVSVRVSMRDFFSDQQRNREFEENQAEEFHNAIEQQSERDENGQTEMKEAVNELKKSQQEMKGTQQKILQILQHLNQRK